MSNHLRISAWKTFAEMLGIEIAGIATGTPSSNTYLRGDFTWGTPSAGGATWGAVSGTLSDQTDLQTAFDAKQPLDADLTAIAALATTGGWAKRTGTNTWTISTPTASDVGADAAGTAAAAIVTHVGLADPHTQYALESALGALAAQSTITASQISDSTATGRAVVVAASQAAARTAIGAGTSSFDGVYASLTSIPSTFAPSTHAANHKSGGSDSIKLDELAAATDVTTLDATTSAHGLMQKYPGGTTTFLRADGSFATPSAAASDANYATGSFTVATETAKILSRHLKLTTTQRATLQGTGTLRIT